MLNFVIPTLTLCLCLALAGAPGAMAQQAVDFDVNYEEWDPVWPVSGQVVVGLNVEGEPTADPVVSVLTGTLAPASLCLEIASRFRNYRMQAESKEASENPVTVFTIYNSTSRVDELRKFAAEELAIRGFVGSCEEASGALPVYLLSAWGEPSEGGVTEFDVLLNARSDEAYLMIGSDPPSPCIRQPDPRQTGFDFRCEITTAAVGELTATVFRRQSGVALERTSFKIVLP
ncbi:hypothetical protein C0V75_16750 [Tabrizicola sp. TH137]|uniref:hypothetical protein n=1 Tax=Tabrizicola sp. TH137 TaxID=2067452 RepID=UPI000C7B8853|nr:hypothetical protein [Tabrizicola sp. TH137]PLL11657.1 hypothetical protein C0V75_16750 [Tabrizicola sp. TH137]